MQKVLILLVNTYSGRPGFTTTVSTGVVTPLSLIPNATYATPPAASTTASLANGTRDDCNSYFSGALFQNVSSEYWNSACELAVAVYGVDLNDFGLWNIG